MSAAIVSLSGLAEQINTAHRACEGAARDAVFQAIEVGRLLYEAKTGLGHGEWIPWVESNCEFGERQARKYMKAFDNRLMIEGKVQNGTTGSDLNFSLRGALRVIDETADQPDDGFTETQRPIADYFRSNMHLRDGKGPTVEQAMEACGASRGSVQGTREKLGLTKATSAPASPKSSRRNNAPPPKPHPAVVNGASNGTLALPSRQERDEESEKYLAGLALRQLVNNSRLDDDAALYHAIEPLMNQIREALQKVVRHRSVETMGPFYRLVHAMLATPSPETWQSCDGCFAREHKDGTCRKCNGCGYVIR